MKSFSHIYQFMLLRWLFCNHFIWSDRRLWSTGCRLFWFCLLSCLTSLHPPLQFPLADLPLSAGLKWQAHVVRAVRVPVQANQHHRSNCQKPGTFRANRERTVQALLLRQAKLQIPSAALVLRTMCLQFSDNFFSPPPKTEVHKIYYLEGHATSERL